MIKFAINKKDGVFNIEKAASFLGINNIAVTIALNFLYSEKFINIKDSTETECKIEIGKTKNIQEFKNEELELILKDIYDFKTKMFTEPDIEEYLQTLS